MSCSSLQNYFPEVVNKTIIPINKKLIIKSYNKSEKNRLKVVNQKLTEVQKMNYVLKGKQRSFYKKF